MDVIIEAISELVRCITRDRANQRLSADNFEAYLDQAEVIATRLIQMDAPHSVQQTITGVCTDFERLLCIYSMDGYPGVMRQCRNERGRPRLHVNENCLQAMCEFGLRVQTMARIFHVSARTVRRRMDDLGLSIHMMYSTISDGDLDAIVRVAIDNHPTWGYRLMQGYLRGLGYRLQQIRVRESMNRVDYLGDLISIMYINLK